MNSTFQCAEPTMYNVLKGFSFSAVYKQWLVKTDFQHTHSLKDP